MNDLLPLFIEVAVLFGIYCVASAVTWSSLHRYKEEETKTAGFLSCVGRLLVFVSRPLAVLAITQVTVWISESVFRWTTPNDWKFRRKPSRPCSVSATTSHRSSQMALEKNSRF